MKILGAKLWNRMERIARFFVFGFLKLFHKELTEEQWEAFMQFVKFGLVGLSNTLISYIVYALLVMVNMHYQLANIVSYVAGIFNSYYWNNKYVFVEEEGKKRDHVKTFSKMLVSYLFSYAVSAGLLFLWVDILGIPALWGPVLNLLVTIPLNFILNKLWAFH